MPFRRRRGGRGSDSLGLVSGGFGGGGVGDYESALVNGGGGGGGYSGGAGGGNQVGDRLVEAAALIIWAPILKL